MNSSDDGIPILLFTCSYVNHFVKSPIVRYSNPKGGKIQMETKKRYGQLSRRQVLRGIGLAASALLVGPALAACTPVAAPPAAQAPAAAEGGPVELELWTFVDTHARWFRSMAEDYKKEVNPNFDLTVTEIAYSDMHDKALIALQTGGVGAPDLVDLEQGRFGGFLRGTGDPGLIDLTDMLTEGGYMEQLVTSRQALYTYQGKTYGVEHALTPVVLYYRADVFEDAGVDLTQVETWDDFIGVGSDLAGDDVQLLLFPEHDVLLRSRGADWFDADGNVTLDSDLSIETMQWILSLQNPLGVADAGPEGNGSKYSATWYGVLKEGKYLAVMGADWYAGFFKDNVPELAGSWKAIPLPAFEKAGLPRRHGQLHRQVLQAHRGGLGLHAVLHAQRGGQCAPLRDDQPLPAVHSGHGQPTPAQGGRVLRGPGLGRALRQAGTQRAAPVPKPLSGRVGQQPDPAVG